MTITEQEYSEWLSSPKVPEDLKTSLSKTSKEQQWVFVGTDFDGQENVNLAELLMPYDNGRLMDIIANGKKENGTDLHSLNAKACGVTRDDGKAIWFGKLYGSSATLTGYTILGNKDYTDYSQEDFTRMEKKLAKRIVYVDADPGVPYYPIKKDALVLFNEQLIKQALFGENIQKKLTENTIGLAELEEVLKKEVRDTGGITLRHGGFNRFIPADSDHKALNYSCQGLGGLAMKVFQRTVHNFIKQAGLSTRVHYRVQATIYDEVDMIVHPDYVETIADILTKSYPETSKVLGMKATYTGGVMVGPDWQSCH